MGGMTYRYIQFGCIELHLTHCDQSDLTYVLYGSIMRRLTRVVEEDTHGIRDGVFKWSWLEEV